MNEFEELRDERDADELARIARALDVSRAASPRVEFLASLRGRIEQEARARRARRGLTLLQGIPLRWAASVAAAVVLAFAGSLAFPQTTALIGPEQRLVLASASGFVAYDPATLQEKARVSVPAPDPWVMLAPDQRTLVFTFGSGTSRQMRVLDIRDPSGFRNVEGLRNPRQFALSRDGSRAYVRDVDAIRVVDVQSARIVATIATPGLEDSPVYLAPDDRRLFQFRPEGELVVYDAAERRELRRVPVDLHDIQGTSASARVVFSPDGSRLYAVGSTGSPTGPVRVLVLDTSTLATVGDRNIDPSSAPRLTNDGAPLARLEEWLGSLGFVALAKELGTVTQIALSPDGRTLYAARGNAGEGILLVDTQRLSAVGLIESGRAVFALQLSPDGNRVFALAAPSGPLGDARLLALDARSYAVVATVPTRRIAADSAVIVYKP